MFKAKPKDELEPVRIHSPSSKITLSHAQSGAPRGRIQNHDLNEYDLWKIEKKNGDHPSWWPLILVVGFIVILKALQGFSIYKRIKESIWPYLMDFYLNAESLWYAIF